MAFMKSARVTLASLAVLCLGTIAAPAANAYSPDIDGDGIPNTWEMKGYDADGDGKIDVDFPAMGADPNHKDIFVEMDYMAGLLPSEDELDRITKIYADLPLRNPDGTTGVNIHLDAGSARSAKYNLGGGNEISYQALDSEFKALHRIKATEGKFNPAREGTFHYMIWGDYYDNSYSSGIANFGGRNFMVTVGDLLGRGKQQHPRGSVRARARPQPRTEPRRLGRNQLQAQLLQRHELPVHPHRRAHG